MMIAEAARARRLADAREEGLKVELGAVQERCKELSKLLEEETRRAMQNAEKARAHDQMAENLDKAETELQHCRNVLNRQTSTLENLSSSEKQMQSQMVDLERTAQMLKLDKEYLQRELHLTVGRTDQLERAHDLLEQENRELKVSVLATIVTAPSLTHFGQQQKDKLVHQILQNQTTARTAYEMQFNSEIERLRVESQQQLELIKQAHREVLDRETRLLRETKDEACKQLAEARKQLLQVLGLWVVIGDFHW